MTSVHSHAATRDPAGAQSPAHRRRGFSRWAAAAVAGLALLGSATRVAEAAAMPRAAAYPSASACTPNGLACTPYMGWNTWYHYGTFGFGPGYDEGTIRAEADAIVQRGLKAAGYTYVWLDAGWWRGGRDADGNIVVDPQQWPHGMNGVADYIHSKGLKAGIYTDAAIQGCAVARPNTAGSFGHYQQDANQFAAWGFDAVKVDFCGRDDPALGNTSAQTLFQEFRDAILNNSSRRPMLFNIVAASDPTEWQWGPETGNSWRTGDDIGPNGPGPADWGHILANIDSNAVHPESTGPGHWNDPDYLMADKAPLSESESRSQFSLWAIMAAPLIIGNSVLSLSDSTIGMLTNREVIAVDQDALGVQGTRIAQHGDGEVWMKPLSDGSKAVVLFNRGDTPTTISTNAASVGLPKAGAYAVRDLWAHTTSESAGTIAASVPPHSAMLYRVAPLQDEVNQYPPLTDVTVTAPPAYPGSAYHIAHPGQTISVAVSFRNDGRPAVTDATVNLGGGPSGWSIGGSPVTASSLPGGESLTGTWQVSIPADASPGIYTLAGAAAYRWSDGTQAGMANGAGPVQVLVPPRGSLYLSDVPWLAATNGYGPVLKDISFFGTPLAIHGTVYPHGLWTNSVASITWYLGGNCSRLTADLGLDDSDSQPGRAPGSVVYQIHADGQKVYDSGLVVNSTPTLHASVDTTGVQILQIDVGDAGDGFVDDNADIAAPLVTCAG